MIKYDRISQCYKIVLNLFGVTVEEFNNILQKVSPIWKNEILSKYKALEEALLYRVLLKS